MLVSVHEYDLAEAATAEEFLAAVREAERRGLFDLPGLVEYRFLRGIKGCREGSFTAQWVYESRAAWADLWGTVDDPVAPADYPESWQVWERELLAPLLSTDPDRIDFTTYEVVAGEGAGGDA